MKLFKKIFIIALGFTAFITGMPVFADIKLDPAAFLLGTWAADCGAASGNGALPVTFFRTPDDRRLWLLSFGIDRGRVEPALTQVVIDHSLPGHRAAIRFIHADGAVMSTILDLTDSNEYFVVESVGPDGVSLTKNGIVLRSGAPAIHYRRCSKRSD